ncbi:hypothetical protein NQ317_004428 [Molorchus minor]|uniref:DNA-directed DNA polymerase n=1 Tax=Molorchus minor TaxID=1323400 RepID=A0ABQ9JNV2_9CUCU|nr:hypothetical protein NQ317_004428 [Molorchus minor]
MIIYVAIRECHVKKFKGGDERPSKRCKMDIGTGTSTSSPSSSSNLKTLTCCNQTLTVNQMNSHRRTLEHRTNACVPLTNDVHVIRVHKIVKVNMEVFGRYVLSTQDSSDLKAFNTPNKVIDQSMDLNETWTAFVDLMIVQTTEFQERDSGWALEQISYLEININKYCPMRGSSYVELPAFVARKRAVVNVRNRDQCCFGWAVTSALFPPTGECSETSSYPHFSTVLNMKGINFPVKLRDISKFEELNNISINVYGLESIFEDNKMKYEIVGPLHYSQKKLHVHVNLLLISQECGLNHHCDIDCGEVRKQYLKLRFIDSFKFLSTSLQNLGNNLTTDQFVETKCFFPDEDKFNLMRGKGVFPYSFVDSLDKLNYPTIPSKDQFFDKLNNEHITDRDYERAKCVWDIFKCQNLGDYSDLYLKADVLLLCDVFENFRKISLEKYKLDPAHYYTAPGLSWDSMLKLTEIELELLTDIDMIHFFKKGIRGGISQCSERKHIANNRFLPNYDANEPTSFISYLDATNLYGHSMTQALPTNGFIWLSVEELANLDIMSISDEGNEGYILEVDVHYPHELHDLHCDLPFLVENVVPPNSKSKLSKLIPNLNDKKQYVVHYKTLQQAISHGLVVTHIHRALKFKQSRWMKKYIDLNTDLRNKATNKFEKNQFKLMTNSVFGKTMENVDNRREIKLVTHWKSIRRSVGANALIAQPNFKTCSIFTEDFVAVHMDTDSLILKILTDNFYEFMIDNPEEFDTSNYEEGNKFQINKSTSVLGRMKDEFPADPIISFYGTGAKAYHVQSVETELKKAKGIKRSVIKQELALDDYKRVVENGCLVFRKMNTFRSDLHDMYTEMKNKVALSHHDDKRFVIPNTCKTLPWGHDDITFYQSEPEQNIQWFISAVNNIGNKVADIKGELSKQTSSLDILIAAIDELQKQ